MEVKSRQETAGFSGDKNWKSIQFIQIFALSITNFNQFCYVEGGVILEKKLVCRCYKNEF